MRDGMSLLDQCASAAEGRVTAETVYRCLGLAGERSTAELLSHIAAGDAAKLLTSFSALYSSGKDLGAMVEELTGACRDLMILKTAPKAAGLLSGMCDPALLTDLLPRFTGAQLLRMTSLLQDTASGFNRSANRRIDVELCLLRLCDPHLDAEPAAMADRLSRLEALAASGRLAPAMSAPVQESVPVQESAPMQESVPVQESASVQTAPPPPEDADAPPWAQDTPPEITPEPEPSPAPPAPPAAQEADFWQRLCNVLRPSMSFRDQWLFRPESRDRVYGRLDGSILRVSACDRFTMGMAEKLSPRIAEAAQQLHGAPVRVVFAVKDHNHSDDGSDAFAQLLKRAQQHPDIVHIKK